MGTLEAAGQRSAWQGISARVRSIDWVPWIEAVKIVALTRMIFFALAYVGTWLFATETTGAPEVTFLQMWERWDAVHFGNIAEHGYLSPDSDTNATAFFPLLPLLARFLMLFGLHVVVAGMIISALATIVAAAYLYRLAEREVGIGTGRRAILYLALFPTGVFLIAPYSEPLFLAGAIPAFYYARRGSWLAAGVPAAVAMGARAAGIFLLAALVVEFVRQRNFKLDNVLNGLTAVLMGGLPLLGYGVFLARAAGNPWHFLLSQKVGWGREFVGPLDAFLNTWRTWEGTYLTNWMFAWRLEIIAAIVGLALVLWALFRKQWSYAVYMGLGLGALVTSSWYYSIPRLLLTWFPVMLFLAAFTKKSERRHEFVLLTFASIAGLGVLLYTKNIWFF